MRKHRYIFAHTIEGSSPNCTHCTRTLNLKQLVWRSPSRQADDTQCRVLFFFIAAAFPHRYQLSSCGQYSRLYTYICISICIQTLNKRCNQMQSSSWISGSEYVEHTLFSMPTEPQFESLCVKSSLNLLFKYFCGGEVLVQKVSEWRGN